MDYSMSRGLLFRDLMINVNNRVSNLQHLLFTGLAMKSHCHGDLAGLFRVPNRNFARLRTFRVRIFDMFTNPRLIVEQAFAGISHNPLLN
jgi:hypothetical protein